MNTTKVKKIIWTINPFDQDISSQANLGKILPDLAAKMEAEVEPFFILDTSKIGTKGEALQVIEKTMQDMMKKFSFPGLLTSKVLAKDLSTITKSVKALVQYGRESNADLIAVGTHGRKGLPRLFLGSFAETLILNSEIPVLTMGPQSFSQTSMKHIIFPSNFDKDSEAVFSEVIALAETLNAKLTLFHSLRPLLESGIIYGPMAAAAPVWIPDNYYEDMEKAKMALGEDWAKKARAKNISCDVFIDTKNDSIADSISQYAEKSGADLVAVAAQSNTIETVILGSIARQVVRQSPIPVWIMRAR